MLFKNCCHFNSTSKFVFNGVVSLVQKELSANLLFHLCILEYLVNYVALLEEHNVIEMTESEFANVVKSLWSRIFSWTKKWLHIDKRVLLPPNEIQFLMGYCDLLIKPDLIRISFSEFKIFHMHITIDAKMASATFSVCFIVSSFFFQVSCLQVSKILLKHCVNLHNCLSIIWQSKECTCNRLNLIIFILKYFIFFIANLLKVQCF